MTEPYRMYDLIEKKKRGGALADAEIAWMIRGYSDGEIPDYQMSAMLMAICLRGMDRRETTALTLAMVRSGETADLSSVQGVKADKHSTGGVGDKTTLVVGPLAASLGVKVAKMSGRGLGHTGGTLDKLESIPGLSTEIDRERFCRIVNEVGIAVIGQSGNLVPADKKLYALRDVTATVDSIPLIASSVMSKKLAAGSDVIVLDVKTGSGAFLKNREDSLALAKVMVDIGTEAGRRCSALVTDMDVPLGHAIGNSLEVIEAVRTLRGEGPEDLTEVCLALTAELLFMAGKGGEEACLCAARQALREGRGVKVLADMVRAQGGDASFIYDTDRFTRAPFARPVTAPADGCIVRVDAEGCGAASVMLGAGRVRKEDTVDYGAGILLRRKYGDNVQKGDVLATLYSSDERLFAEAERRFLRSYVIGERPPQPPGKRILARVSRRGTVLF